MSRSGKQEAPVITWQRPPKPFVKTLTRGSSTSRFGNGPGAARVPGGLAASGACGRDCDVPDARPPAPGQEGPVDRLAAQLMWPEVGSGADAACEQPAQSR